MAGNLEFMLFYATRAFLSFKFTFVRNNTGIRLANSDEGQDTHKNVADKKCLKLRKFKY